MMTSVVENKGMPDEMFDYMCSCVCIKMLVFHISLLVCLYKDVNFHKSLLMWLYTQLLYMCLKFFI
jgi:hypothetical protein